MDLFKLKQNQTTVGREIGAGVVTFMAMAYIIFVNPKILAAAMGEEFVPGPGGGHLFRGRAAQHSHGAGQQLSLCPGLGHGA